MALEQRQREYINPATPVQKVSPKAEKYKSIAMLFETGAKYLKDDDKDAPKFNKNIISHVYRAFDDLPSKEKVAPGKEDLFFKDFTAQDLYNHNPDLEEVYSTSEIADAIKGFRKHGTLRGPQVEGKKVLKRLLSEGTKFDPMAKDLDKAYGFSLDDAFEFATDVKIDKVLSSEEKKEAQYLWNYISAKNSIQKYVAQNSNRAGIKNYRQIRKNISKIKITAKQRQTLLRELMGHQKSVIEVENARNKQLDDINLRSALNGQWGDYKSIIDAGRQYKAGKIISNLQGADNIVSFGDGEISYDQAYGNIQNIDYSTNPFLKAKMIKALNTRANQIHQVMYGSPVDAKGTSPLDQVMTSNAVHNLMDTPYEQRFTTELYRMLMKSKELPAEMFRSVPEGVRHSVVKKLFNMGSLSGGEYIKALEGALVAADKADVSADEFADALASGDESKIDTTALKLFRYMEANKPRLINTPGGRSEMRGANNAIRMLGYEPTTQEKKPEQKTGFINWVKSLFGGGTQEDNNEQNSNSR